MGLLATDEGGDRVLCPEGTHIARCIQVLDLGKQAGFNNKEQHKVRFSFETPEEGHIFNDKKGEEPFMLSRELTLSTNEKSHMRGFLEGWLGRSLTDDEVENGFDVLSMINETAMITVVHAKAKNSNNEYANIKSIAALPKKTKCPDLINPSYTLQLSEKEFDQDVFDQLNQYIKKKIAESPEFKELVAKGLANYDGATISDPVQEPEVVGADATAAQQQDDEEDDLPF